MNLSETSPVRGKRQKSAIVAVTNDLSTDQRAHRTCLTLTRIGYDVLLTGRLRQDSRTLAVRPYRLHRMRLLFEKGPLFYAEYNMRLFFFLLFNPPSLYISNDTDTLLATYLAWRTDRALRKTGRYFQHDKKNTKAKLGIPQDGYSGAENETAPLRDPVHLHDCHEYFRGMPELSGRKTVTGIWKLIEDLIFPRLQFVMAVNQSVAGLYHRDYGNRFRVMRNVPLRKEYPGKQEEPETEGSIRKPIILYQGAVNVDRGIEEIISAMQFTRSNARLVIAGTGDIYRKMIGLANTLGVSGKVTFLGQVPFEDLYAVTVKADLGLSIEKDVCRNYHASLPNKFLDYIQAHVPVLVSPFPEMKAIIDQYGIGEFLESHDPVAIAAQVDRILEDGEKLDRYRKNMILAASELCWENEEKVLVATIREMEEGQR